MSETWFRAYYGYGGGYRIEPKEIQSHTKSRVTLMNDRCENKQSSYYAWFPTWDLAHECLLKHAESELQSARRSLEQWQGYYGNVKGMQKPDGVA